MTNRRMVGALLALAVGVGGATAAPAFSDGPAGGQQASGAEVAGAPILKTFIDNNNSKTIVKVNKDGNVASFESPAGYEHIGIGALSEGYVLCFTKGSSSVKAWDVMDTTSGFGPSSNPTTSKVVRTTTDGSVTLEQEFAFVGPERQLTITHYLKNNTSTTLTNVRLNRQADLDLSTGGTKGWANYQNTFIRSSKGSVTAAANPTAAPAGREAQSMTLRHILGVERTAAIGAVINLDCVPTSAASPVTGDYGAVLSYSLASLKPGARVMVAKLAYERH